MPNRIYPTILPDARLALGYDGSDFRGLLVDTSGRLYAVVGFDGSLYRFIYLDKQTDGQWATRVSTIVDRAPVDASQSLDVTVANHGYTDRVTYTVPSGKRAYLQCIWSRLEIPASGKTLDLRIKHNERWLVQHIVVSTTTATDSSKTWPCGLWLRAGDTIKIGTASDDATARFFRATVDIIEFSA